MRGVWRQTSQVLIVMVAAAALTMADTFNAPAPGTLSNGAGVSSPPPGTLNYVEGQVSIQGRQETSSAVGSVYLEPNQEIQTGDGNAEVLLTPGVYLRLGHNSAVTMISPNLADTQVQVTRGAAMLEVDELFKQNDLTVDMGKSTTQIEKQGLYSFTVQPAAVRVVDGEAVLNQGGRDVKLKKGREVRLAEGQNPKPRKFDKKAFDEDALYRWSMLRSEYATESNINEGNALEAAGGWGGPGWYWDPWMFDFAFMPGWGLGWGPFGYPFFSPWAVGWAPFYGFAGYGRRYGEGFYHYGAGGHRALPPLAHQTLRGAPGFHSFPHSRSMGRGGMSAGPHGFAGRSAGGFRGGFHGGGFGGGGFHGGGFGGGGFHGGGGHR